MHPEDVAAANPLKLNDDALDVEIALCMLKSKSASGDTTASCMDITRRLVTRPKVKDVGLAAKVLVRVKDRLQSQAGQQNTRFVHMPKRSGERHRQWGVTAAFVLHVPALRRYCGLTETAVQAEEAWSDETIRETQEDRLAETAAQYVEAWTNETLLSESEYHQDEYHQPANDEEDCRLNPNTNVKVVDIVNFQILRNSDDGLCVESCERCCGSHQHLRHDCFDSEVVRKHETKYDNTANYYHHHYQQHHQFLTNSLNDILLRGHDSAIDSTGFLDMADSDSSDGGSSEASSSRSAPLRRSTSQDSVGSVASSSSSRTSYSWGRVVSNSRNLNVKRSDSLESLESRASSVADSALSHTSDDEASDIGDCGYAQTSRTCSGGRAENIASEINNGDHEGEKSKCLHYRENSDSERSDSELEEEHVDTDSEADESSHSDLGEQSEDCSRGLGNRSDLGEQSEDCSRGLGNHSDLGEQSEDCSRGLGNHSDLGKQPDDCSRAIDSSDSESGEQSATGSETGENSDSYLVNLSRSLSLMNANRDCRFGTNAENCSETEEDSDSDQEELQGVPPHAVLDEGGRLVGVDDRHSKLLGVIRWTSFQDLVHVLQINAEDEGYTSAAGPGVYPTQPYDGQSPDIVQQAFLSAMFDSVEDDLESGEMTEFVKDDDSHDLTKIEHTPNTERKDTLDVIEISNEPKLIEQAFLLAMSGSWDEDLENSDATFSVLESTGSKDEMHFHNQQLEPALGKSLSCLSTDESSDPESDSEPAEPEREETDADHFLSSHQNNTSSPESSTQSHSSESSTQTHSSESSTQTHSSESFTQTHSSERSAKYRSSESLTETLSSKCSAQTHSSESFTQTHSSECSARFHSPESSTEPHSSESYNQTHSFENSIQTHSLEIATQTYSSENLTRTHDTSASASPPSPVTPHIANKDATQSETSSSYSCPSSPVVSEAGVPFSERCLTLGFNWDSSNESTDSVSGSVHQRRFLTGFTSPSSSPKPGVSLFEDGNVVSSTTSSHGRDATNQTSVSMSLDSHGRHGRCLEDCSFQGMVEESAAASKWLEENTVDSSSRHVSSIQHVNRSAAGPEFLMDDCSGHGFSTETAFSSCFSENVLNNDDSYSPYVPTSVSAFLSDSSRQTVNTLWNDSCSGRNVPVITESPFVPVSSVERTVDTCNSGDLVNELVSQDRESFKFGDGVLLPRVSSMQFLTREGFDGVTMGSSGALELNDNEISFGMTERL